MSDLIKQAGDNVGGFSELQIIDVDNIQTLPEHSDYIISGDIVTIISWFTIYFTPKTLTLNDGENVLDKGIIYKPIIKFFHPKDNAVSLKVLQEFLQKNIIVKIKDNNNNIKIVGSLTAPLRLKYKLAAEGSFSSRKGYNVTIYGKSLLPSLFFTGTTYVYIP